MIGEHQLDLRTSSARYPYITITRFEAGKDPEYNFYMKVFAYMDNFPKTPSKKPNRNTEHKIK